VHFVINITLGVEIIAFGFSSRRGQSRRLTIDQPLPLYPELRTLGSRSLVEHHQFLIKRMRREQPSASRCVPEPALPVTRPVLTLPLAALARNSPFGLIVPEKPRPLIRPPETVTDAVPAPPQPPGGNIAVQVPSYLATPPSPRLAPCGDDRRVGAAGRCRPAGRSVSAGDGSRTVPERDFSLL
jgi:hypothetical protein